MHRSVASTFLLALALAVASGCASRQATRKASMIDYLYPKGAEAQPPADIVFRPPVRVGVAFAPTDGRIADGFDEKREHDLFAPTNGPIADGFDEKRKHDLLERIARAFREVPDIGSVTIVPSSDLRPGGGFENLDQVAALHGIQIMALLSYEQMQFDEMNTASITYWTVVGAYVVDGNRNETRTLIDAAVFDIRSRALILRTSGSSSDRGSSTAIGADAELREASAHGFSRATDDLIANLQKSLAELREQAKAGTLHGIGTPAITTVRDGGSGGAQGVGAVGPIEIGALALALASLVRRRAPVRARA